MTDLAATMAFGLLIGGQFLAAIYLVSRRSTLYPDQLFRRHSAIQDATRNGGGWTGYLLTRASTTPRQGRPAQDLAH